MVKQALKECRSWSRAKRVLSIQFRLVRSGGQSLSNPWSLSTTKDISLAGLSFYTDQEYRVNDILEISLTMSGIVDILKGLAKVIRIEQKMTGVYFLVAVKFIENKSRYLKTITPQRRTKANRIKRI